MGLGRCSFSNWVGPFKSNEVCKESHNWSEKANYQIKVRAKDTKGGESQWSDSLEVSVPRNINTAKKQILAIFNLFKFLHPFIRLFL